jgi:hypothetical protein
VNVANPDDYVARGQSFEDASAPGSLFVVTEVRRTWSAVYRTEQWLVTLMCVVSPGPWFKPGGETTVTVWDGVLRNGYARVA